MHTADIETFQVPWELNHMLGIVAAMSPKTILEIGCWKGGTLWHWIDLPSVEKVVAVDDEMRNADQWHEWADRAGVELVTIEGRSQKPDVVAEARREGPYDLVFIDGDHTYDAVLEDWNNYSHMVADGGAIALHDIIPRLGYGVDMVWTSAKAHHASRWIEIGQRAVEQGNEGTCGIGIAWL